MDDQSHEQANGPFENRPQPLYVTLILDETGSMQDCKGAAIAGFNHYVATLRQEPAETRVTLTLFNSKKTEVRYQAAPVARVHDLDVETYRPNDTTPLYDAIAYADRRQAGGAGRSQKAVCHSDGWGGKRLEGIQPVTDLRYDQGLRKRGVDLPLSWCQSRCVGRR